VSHGISVIFPGVSLTTASTATLKIKIINLFDQGFSSTYDQTNSITVTNNFGDKLCAPPSMAIVSNCDLVRRTNQIGLGGYVRNVDWEYSMVDMLWIYLKYILK
jgi:hypothetical protein